MQRRLVLIRHAQTADGSPDIARELTQHGREQAVSLGRWLTENDVVPDLVVVSPARRAQQTWHIASRELPAQPDVQVDDRIYDNTVDDILAVIRDTEADVTTLLIIGHNPSLGMLAGATSFPTAAIAMGEFAAEWSEHDEQAWTVRMVAAH